jgi:hypothetical protein
MHGNALRIRLRRVNSHHEKISNHVSSQSPWCRCPNQKLNFRLTCNKTLKDGSGIERLHVKIEGNVYGMRDMIVFIHQLGFSQGRV